MVGLVKVRVVFGEGWGWARVKRGWVGIVGGGGGILRVVLFRVVGVRVAERVEGGVEWCW